MKSANAWPQAKTDRMLELYDEDPSHETIAEIAAEYRVSVPTIRARLNRHGRYSHVASAVKAPPATMQIPADAFKDFTRADMAITTRLELAMG